MNRRTLFIIAVACVAIAMVGSVLLPLPRPAGPQISLPVLRVLACPTGDSNLGKTTVTVTDQENFTAGELNALPSDPTTQTSFQDPDKVVVVRGSASVGGVSSFAQTDTGMVAPCSAPITTGSWNGVMTSEGATLVMTNIDATAAVVDVSIYGQTGQLTPAGLRDIPVASGATQALPIDEDLVTSDTPITVQVRASKGRVLALLRIMGTDGDDWQVPQPSTDTDLTIAGIPAGDGLRTLSVTNTDPSSKAEVTVQILGTTGPFAPLGMETIEVPPSRVSTVDLTQALGGQAAAVHLVSNQPVTATVVVSGPDVAGISAQPPLSGTVVLPPLGGTLWAANPGTDPATVSLRFEDANGAAQTSDLTIPPQANASVDFPSTGTSVTVSTDSPVVRSSLVLTDPGWSILPVISGGGDTLVDVPPLAPGLG
ncbi:MAG: DUF5719 family protein [Propionibacteriaceae bacterium]|nr:DUF5719 family protein [Propionibacteriaceae bacterium]